MSEETNDTEKVENPVSTSAPFDTSEIFKALENQAEVRAHFVLALSRSGAKSLFADSRQGAASTRPAGSSRSTLYL